MRINFAKIIQGLILSVLLLMSAGIFAALLYQKMDAYKIEQHQEVNATIQRLKEVDTRWNEDILKSRLSLNSNYDPITDPLSVLEELEQQLASYINDEGESSRRIEANLAQYKALGAQKIELVERFKSQNSILRNSLRFIPTAVRDLLAEIEREKNLSNAAHEKLIDLENQAKSLLQGLLEFNLLPQEELVSFLEQASKNLESAKEQYTRAVKERLEITLAHARTVLRQKPVVDELLAAIVALPTVSSIDKVQIAFNVFYEQALQQRDYYRTLLVAYIALVIVVMIAVLIHLQSRQHMRLLRSANESLEERVKARTHELDTAYQNLKQSQAQLVQSEKMSALGQMVAGVAHEINTPLAYSRGNLDVIAELLPDLDKMIKAVGEQVALRADPRCPADRLNAQLDRVDELGKRLHDNEVLADIRGVIDASASGLDQITEMVSNLKNFSRIDRKKVDDIDVNASLDSSLMIARNELKHKVEIVKNYGDVPLISCMPSTINQVFLNLLINASQAIEDYGTITLTTQRRGNNVEIIIADDGAGIPQDVLSNIYDPFFTTKDVGKGTGLGLAIVYEIIQQHNGTISVNSEAGKGTAFTVRLPVSERQSLSKVA